MIDIFQIETTKSVTRSFENKWCATVVLHSPHIVTIIHYHQFEVFLGARLGSSGGGDGEE